MCGICGFHGKPDTPVDRADLVRTMLRAIGHRGPDGRGVFDDGRTSLGHARLSIIDIAGGGQPMCNGDRTVWLTFNGEIFNFVELRRELVARGRSFRTNSDAEVILQMYEEMGPDCVSAFNGDFAFALWDTRKDLFMLARDRLGVRPLYYSLRRGCLFFASEIKALLQVPGIRAQLDHVALDQIFTFWFPLAPRTPFKDVLELPPGHVFVTSPGRTQLRRYWRLDYPTIDESRECLDRGRQAALVEQLGDLLADATRIRLRADVPVGAYLSGGLDSAIVTSMIGKVSRAPPRTFSVTFGSAEFDESRYQQQMVDWLGSQHTAIRCESSAIARSFPGVIRHCETPILRSAPAPLLGLAAAVRDAGMKVVLTGEGADEIFAGYDIFKEAKVRRFWAREPDSTSRPGLLRLLYPYLNGLRAQSTKYLEAFFGEGLSRTDDPLYSHLPRFRTTAAAKLFFSQEQREALRGYDALAELRDDLPPEFARWHPLSQAQYLETTYLLPGYILSSQGDRVAMAHAVECRYPFLDHRVVEFAARIPPHLKIRGLREKHILRECARNLVPQSICSRGKQPYRAPDSSSFVGSHEPAYVDDCLSASALERSGCFDERSVGRLLAKSRRRGLTGFRENMAFVGILSTQLWHREFARATESRAPSAALTLSLEGA